MNEMLMQFYKREQSWNCSVSSSCAVTLDLRKFGEQRLTTDQVLPPGWVIYRNKGRSLRHGTILTFVCECWLSGYDFWLAAFLA